MIPVPDEKLMAYADGELSPGETAALDALLADDAHLRARLAPFIVTRNQLATAFEHTLHEPVPDRLVAAIRNAPVRTRRAPSTHAAMDLPLDGLLRALGSFLFPSGAPTLATAFSVAALVAAAAGGGWMLARLTEAPDLIVADGTGLTASNDLARALETLPSGAPADVGGGRVTPVQSFRTADKGICREYVVAADAGPDFAGVACKTPDGAWHLAIHVATAKALEAEGPYATAGRPSAPAVDALVNNMMSGDALGREDEEALLRSGWQAPPPAGAATQDQGS